MAREPKNPKTGMPYYTRRLRQRDLSYLKPKKFSEYLTLSEVAAQIPVDSRWLRKLEAEDRIPRAARVPMGKLEVRLWSPSQVEEIRQIIKGHQVGRPKT